MANGDQSYAVCRCGCGTDVYRTTTHIYTAEEHAEVEKLRALVNQSLEAMQWILGGEPIDTLMIDAVNAIKLHQAQQSKKGGKA